MGALGFIKAIFWPGFLVYEALKYWGRKGGFQNF